MMVSFCAVLFPRDVLDEILDLIASVSEGFPTYYHSAISICNKPKSYAWESQSRFCQFVYLIARLKKEIVTLGKRMLFFVHMMAFFCDESLK